MRHLLVIALLAACGTTPTPAATSTSGPIPPAPSTESANTSAPKPSASAPASSGTAFVRSPPSSHKPGADAVDECLQSGGNYFSCSGAYQNETDPIVKRYLWRIMQAHAAGMSGYG